MTQIACPNCGEMLTCNENAIGRKRPCPRCRVLLQLDADADGRPTYGRPRRRFGLVRLAVALAIFLTGLGIGFLWGASTTNQASSGLSVSSFGVFSASNNVVVDDRTVVSPPPAVKPAPAGPAGKP